MNWLAQFVSKIFSDTFWPIFGMDAYQRNDQQNGLPFNPPFNAHMPQLGLHHNVYPPQMVIPPQMLSPQQVMTSPVPVVVPEPTLMARQNGQSNGNDDVRLSSVMCKA